MMNGHAIQEWILQGTPGNTYTQLRT